jgi:Domain of unknown function (DUF4253)
MPETRPKRITARLTLVERESGDVGIEIATSRRLEASRYGDRVAEPSEFLQAAGLFQIQVTAPHEGSWRYIDVFAGAMVDGAGHELVSRYFDLSESSPERPLLQRLAGQDEVVLCWVNEQVEVTQENPAPAREGIAIALENTRGISQEAWREELAQLKWETSESWHPGPRPRRHRRRTAQTPTFPIPYFSQRSGSIPANGRPLVEGIQLAAGSRRPARPASYWATDELARDAPHLASELVAVFGRTGLWPLLWEFSDEPEDYMYGSGDVDAIDRIDVESALRARWNELPANPSGLSPLTSFPDRPLSATPTAASVPLLGDVADVRARLLLVPCNRPADSITALGGVATSLDAPTISSVLRTWEERYAAVPVSVAPGAITIAVGAPPTTLADAQRLAAEHYVLCQPGESGQDGWLKTYASNLLNSSSAPGSDVRPDRWRLRWNS